MLKLVLALVSCLYISLFAYIETANADSISATNALASKQSSEIPVVSLDEIGYQMIRIPQLEDTNITYTQDWDVVSGNSLWALVPTLFLRLRS